MLNNNGGNKNPSLTGLMRVPWMMWRACLADYEDLCGSESASLCQCVSFNTNEKYNWLFSTPGCPQFFKHVGFHTIKCKFLKPQPDKDSSHVATQDVSSLLSVRTAKTSAGIVTEAHGNVQRQVHKHSRLGWLSEVFHTYVRVWWKAVNTGRRRLVDWFCVAPEVRTRTNGRRLLGGSFVSIEGITL